MGRERLQELTKDECFELLARETLGRVAFVDDRGPVVLPVNELARLLGTRGFAVQRVSDMDGWLAYHAAFVACVAAALYRCGTDPGRLSADRVRLRLMCAALTEAFGALRRAGVTGLPRNLAVLHSPLLMPVAVRYWARTMRSPKGELWFAAHSRHAEAEMRAVADQVIRRIGSATKASHLRQLLGAADVDANDR